MGEEYQRFVEIATVFLFPFLGCVRENPENGVASVTIRKIWGDLFDSSIERDTGFRPPSLYVRPGKRELPTLINWDGKEALKKLDPNPIVLPLRICWVFFNPSFNYYALE